MVLTQKANVGIQASTLPWHSFTALFPRHLWVGCLDLPAVYNSGDEKGDITDYRASSVVARDREGSQRHGKLSFPTNPVNISDVPFSHINHQCSGLTASRLNDRRSSGSEASSS